MVDRRIRAVESEVEAVRFDFAEAQENIHAPLGDDLRAASILHAYDRDNSKTLYGAVTKLQTDILKLETLKRHLTEVQQVF